MLSKLDNYHPHLLITILIACDSLENFKPNSRQIQNFYKADYDCITSELSSIDWYDCFLRSSEKHHSQNKVGKRYLKYNNPRDKHQYNILRERCHKLISECYSKYCARTEAAISKDPRKFWQYMKDKRGGMSEFPAEMNLNNLTAASGSDIANLFVMHFFSVYTLSNTSVTYTDSNINNIITNIK